MAGSFAGLKTAGPNPSHTGVVGLNVCVRSTNFLLEMIRHASASDSPLLGGLGFGAAHPKKTISDTMTIPMATVIRFIEVFEFWPNLRTLGRAGHIPV